MNLRIQKMMKLHRLMDAAGEHGSDGGGTGTGAGASAAGEGGSEGAGGSTDGGNGGASGDDQGGKQGEQGENKPSDAEAKLLKDVMRHKKRAGELEAQLAQVNEKLKQFEGIDVTKVREMLAAQEEAERKGMEARGEYDRLIKQMGERHTQEKTQLLGQLEERDRTTRTLQAQIAELTVGNAFASSKFVQEDLTLTPTKARVIYGSHFEFKDGKVVGYDKPAGAVERTILVDATGEPLSFEEAMKKIIEADPDRDQLIRSKMRPGAGSTTQSKVSKKADDAASKNLTGVDRIAAGLAALAKQK